MNDTIETRTIEERGYKVRVDMMADYDSTPDDADCYDVANKEAWSRDEWRYVGLVGRVVTDEGLEGPTDVLFGIEHGTMSDTLEADAWEWVPAIVNGNSITMGSCLWHVVDQAISTFEDAVKVSAEDLAVKP